MLEFAITAPVLFLFVFAAVDFGRVNMLRHTIDHAAYEAARAGIVAGATAKDVKDRARSVLAIVGARGAKIQLTPGTITPDTPRITVSVDIPLRRNSWVASRFFRNNRFSSTCTLNREQYENVSFK